MSTEAKSQPMGLTTKCGEQAKLHKPTFKISMSLKANIVSSFVGHKQHLYLIAQMLLVFYLFTSERDRITI